VRDVLRKARLPAHADGPAAVLGTPGVPDGVGVTKPAFGEGGVDRLQQRLHSGAVGQHRVCGGGQFGDALTLQQDGMGETLHLRGVHPGGFRDLPDRCACPDPGLNVLGSQHASDLVVSRVLAWPGTFTTRGGAQPVIEPDQELVGRIATLTDDVLTVDIESDECQFPHAGLL
jgi:hypothetical protein